MTAWNLEEIWKLQFYFVPTWGEGQLALPGQGLVQSISTGSPGDAEPIWWPQIGYFQAVPFTLMWPVGPGLM
jgi:hypothetical protein